MKKYIRNIGKIRKYVRDASQYRSIFGQIIDVIRHKILINVNPEDYYRFEFYRDGKTMEEKSRYVTLGGSRYWPFENNEYKYTTTLSNKYIQKTMLLGFGLPTPRLITNIGHTFEIQTREQFDRFLDGIDSDIILKPVSGAGGHNVLLFSPQEGGRGAGKNNQARDDIWDHLRIKMDSGWLVEERALNTPAMAAIYPRSLNTFRVITIKTSDNKWHMAACAHKFGSRESVVDNNKEGIMGSLDKNGVIFHVHDFISGEDIENHPDTGAKLIGLKVDGYNEVIQLALKASHKFGFFGTIGWDIAYTDRGPMIIEGNISWGCSSIQRGIGGLITDEMAKGLRRHHMFSRWDKNRLHPNPKRR